MSRLRNSADVLYNEVLRSPDWVYLFLSVSVWGLICPLYSTYLMLWINSFVEKSVLADDYEVKAAFTQLNWYCLPIASTGILVCMLVIDNT